MKVGEYARYRKLNFNNKSDVRIAKITDIMKDTGYYDESGKNLEFVFFDDKNGEYKNRIIKSSPNIIDLIKIGDYVNGIKITSISDDNKGKYVFGYGKEGMEGEMWFYNDDIKSIVTKEQFESMQYNLESEAN